MSGGLDYEEEMDNLPKDLLDYPDDVEMEESNPSPDSSSSSKGPSPDPSKKRKIPQKKPASPKKAKTSKKSKSSINPVYGLVPLLKTHLVVWFHETHRDVCNEKRDVWIQTIQQLMQQSKPFEQKLKQSGKILIDKWLKIIPESAAVLKALFKELGSAKLACVCPVKKIESGAKDIWTGELISEKPKAVMKKLIICTSKEKDVENSVFYTEAEYAELIRAPVYLSNISDFIAIMIRNTAESIHVSGVTTPDELFEKVFEKCDLSKPLSSWKIGTKDSKLCFKLVNMYRDVNTYVSNPPK